MTAKEERDLASSFQSANTVIWRPKVGTELRAAGSAQP